MQLLSGELLADRSWLAARVARLAAQPGSCQETRTNATLWWYSASLVLLGPAVHALVVSGTALDLSPSAIRFTLRPTDYLERVVPGEPLAADSQVSDAQVSDSRMSGPKLSSTQLFGEHLDAALAPVVEALAAVGDATEQSLWAVAADSLTTRVLASVSVTPAGPSAAPGLADAIATSSRLLRPLPRYVEVDPDARRVEARTAVQGLPVHEPMRHTPRLYPQRVSCCLLWRVPAGKCITCPAQTPEARAERLLRHARSQG